MEYYKGSPSSEGAKDDVEKIKTSSQNGLSLEEISADEGEVEVTSKYTSLSNSLSTKIFSADGGEDGVTNKEESLPNDLAKEKSFADEDVAPQTGVESKDEDANEKAKWAETFDLNEPPQDEDANENN